MLAGAVLPYPQHPSGGYAMPRIIDVQIYAMEQHRPDYSWSPVMPHVLNTDTIVRITDENGMIGVGSVCTFTEYGVDRAVLESIRPLAMNLLQQDNPSPQAFWHEMKMRRPGVSNMAMGAIDGALWDLAARQHDLPLYQYLGGTNQGRSRLPAYASVPILDNPDAYIALIDQLRGSGFSIFKFHYQSVAEPDIALINAVSDAHGHDCQFMFDAENLYDEESARKVADVMADRGYIWLEAPFNDHDWASYRRLKDHARLPIIAAGNSVVDPAHLAQAIAADCWDAIRIDAATAGGITPSLEVFAQARNANLKVELQSWGSAISTSANLHLAFAHHNSSYVEIPVPRGDFTVPGTAQFDLTSDGYVMAPTAPGIGLELDWAVIETSAAAHAEHGRR